VGSKSKTKSSQLPSARAIDDYPKDSIKEMAVLFTDIVGSSTYFKSQGDIAGRKILKRHQDIASPVIAEHSGVVVKLLGDSVMAYFLDAREGLKSAIKIQQQFKRHNEKKEPKDQIHVRICIHFGKGIIEEKDIFGDVVNMAAKILSLVQGDQIFISKEVYDQVKGLSGTRFELVNVSDDKDIYKDLTIYRVVWDEGIDLNPLTSTLVYFKPIWNLSKNSFVNAWENFLKARENLWGEDVAKEGVLPNKSVAVVAKRASSSLVVAKRVIEFFKNNTGVDGTPLLPMQTIIDTGPYVKKDKLNVDNLKVDWESIEPGEIYVSASTYELFRDKENLTAVPSTAANGTPLFYKLTLNNQKENDSYLFSYQKALIQGENQPCFYCGDRKHLTTKCPSKQITEITRGMNRLGYLSFNEINKLFFNYLAKTTSNNDVGLETHGETDSPNNWACYGFYELKTIFQLRFLRTMWNSWNENWDKIKERRGGTDDGGLAWIGLDCIRVSNMKQAESLLEDALRKNPNDYKVYCAMGFLNVEKNDILRAKNCFKKALDCAKTTPRKIFILFLLARLYELNKDPVRAEDGIKRILHLNPFCPEALYYEILFKFRKGNHSVALNQLTKLIGNHREYFVFALIDPELADFSGMIHQQLRNLLDEVRHEAIGATQKAEKNILNRLRELFDKEEKEVVEANSQWSKIQDLSKTDSYFGYLDMIHYATRILTLGRASIEDRKNRLFEILDDLDNRLYKYLNFLTNFPFAYLSDPLSQQLKRIQEKTDENRESAKSKSPSKFKETFALLEELSAQLDQIESKIRRIETIRKVLEFTTSFFKKSLLFQLANLFMAIILFPIMAYYLSFIIFGFKISPHHIWEYQKGALVLGGISGFLLALLTTAQSTYKK
jgi:class 3 adenylate cyclase/tetratricopeptide (TPR) repeat protein